MTRILLITAFTLVSTLVFAQEKTKSDSKWKSSIDGKLYQMEVTATGVSTKSTEKPHITFAIKGSTNHLTKIALAGKELTLSVPISKESQEINITSGTYKFKFYHDKLGIQEFEVDLKNGDDKTVILTLD